MNTLRNHLHTLIFFLLVFGLAMNAYASSQGGGGGGRCRDSLTITPSANLKFGAFSTTNTGQVIVDTSGNRSASGGIFLMGGTVSAALFDIKGCDDESFSIILPDAATLSSATASMALNNFVSLPGGTGVTNSDGNALLKVGATLHVGSPQPPGDYSGSFVIEVLYQ